MVDMLFILFLLACGFVIYFAPSIVAATVNHSKYPSIFIINLFLGWAFVPWVLVLAWAVAESKKVDTV